MAAASERVARRRGRVAARRPGTPAGSASPTAGRAPACAPRGPEGSASLIVSVTARRRSRRRSPRRRVDAALHQLAASRAAAPRRGPRRPWPRAPRRERCAPTAERQSPPRTRSGGPRTRPGHRHHHAVAGAREHVEAPVEHRPAGTDDERLGPGGTKAFAAAAGGNDPDDGQGVLRARPLRRGRLAVPARVSVRDRGTRGGSPPRPPPSSRAYISSEARIFFARVYICFSPVESPFSVSRMARLRTTSASSNTSPVLIFSRLCLKRRFQFFGIWLTSSRRTDSTFLTSSSPITRRRPARSAFQHGTITVMSL